MAKRKFRKGGMTLYQGMEKTELLLKGAGKFGISLTQNQEGKFFKYMELLKEWNSKVNLTSIEEDNDIILKHFIDSLSIMPCIKTYIDSIKNKNISLIDVGTGAGFPGIPVKIAYNEINMVLLDSLSKRIKFLNEVISQLGLEGIKSVHSRAEDSGMNVEYREKFDISVARAVSSLPVLLEYCLPFVKVEGLFIAMKGSDATEIDTCKNALDILGGKIEEVINFQLPFSDIKRNIIIIKKFRHTSSKYPRKAGKPSKEPLL